MREVCESPSSVMHYVLLCKDEAPKTNTSHNLPLVLSSLLQEFQEVFPDELPPGLPPLRGIEHRGKHLEIPTKEIETPKVAREWC